VHQSFFMPPCHTVPFLRPGIVVDARVEETAPDVPDRAGTRAVEECDYCGSAKLEWRKCKLICADCRQINKSCADL
jgi:hypothetical protein